MRASVSEFTACLIRVPTELLKQQAQVAPGNPHIFAMMRNLYAQKGFKGFYTG